MDALVYSAHGEIVNVGFFRIPRILILTSLDFNHCLQIRLDDWDFVILTIITSELWINIITDEVINTSKST